jgi:hypothetical protein
MHKTKDSAATTNKKVRALIAQGKQNEANDVADTYCRSGATEQAEHGRFTRLWNLGLAVRGANWVIR